MTPKDSGYITLRVNEAEKKYFESRAASMETSTAGLLRYELDNHYKLVERNQLMAELKRLITVGEAPEKRAELMHVIASNVHQTIRWMKNKIAAYERSIRHMSSFVEGMEKMEQKALRTLEQEG